MTAALLLREITRLYVREQRKHAKCGDGTSTVQCHVLTELFRDEGLSQQTLVGRLGFDKGWISRAVDALVADGCIERRPNPEDRRSTLLFLTPSGRHRAGSLEQNLNLHASQLLNSLPADSHRQIEDSLQMLLKALTCPSAGAGACASLELRPALDSDRVFIERMLIQEGLPLDGVQEHLADFAVGELDRRVVCAAGFEFYGTDALLRSVVMSPAERGKGRGKQLISYMVEYAAARGVTRLYLLTTTAAAYFSKMGFVHVDRALLPQALQQSRELQGACPASASAMSLRVDQFHAGV
jgi:DNA-binding MarR family transcriptional regulator/N-acetylglutamate synthase-like GNAT family acetyltransferase